jgi:hypothetical protein
MMNKTLTAHVAAVAITVAFAYGQLAQAAPLLTTDFTGAIYE